MGAINILDFQVANLIAAGEVVDRPASACKELLENSIDAGASIITVEIKNGGVSFIRVSDNGRGMAREDVPIAIKRHATSKIKNASDLDSILTLGFRGEALAAISSVSHMRIMTKRREDPAGTLLECYPGGEPVIGEVGISDGTTIIAENLFSNVPARRKFLKKDKTEAMAVAAAIEKVALSSPGISIRLIIDGQTRFCTAGDGIQKNTIYALLGRDFANRMIEVSRDSDGIAIEGYVGTPDNVRPNRNYQNFFINGRYVKSKCALAALEQAFTSYCPAEKFPTCVLNIRLAPQKVDVNVHPAKLEVKFSDEKAVFEAIYYAVRGALERHIPRPQLELSGKTATDINYAMMKTLNAFVPIEDGANRQKADKSPYLNRKNVKVGQLSVEDQLSEPAKAEGNRSDANRNDVNRFEAHRPDEMRPATQNSEPAKPSAPPQPERKYEAPAVPVKSDAPLESAPDAPIDLDALADAAMAAHFESKSPAEKSEPDDLPPVIAALKPHGNIPHPAPLPIPDEIERGIPQAKISAAPPTSEEPAEPSDKSESVPEVKAEESAAKTARAARSLPPYRIIGEAFYSYVFVETGDKVLIIDKHAAHERIIFEELKRNLSTRAVVSQILLVPIEVGLTPVELSAVEEYQNDIAGLGFELHRKDENTIAVTAIPAQIEASAAADMLVTIADRVANGTGSAEISRDIIFEKALYQASCNASIKAGHEEGFEHIKWIVEKLLMLDDIKFCPHGRPVAFEMSKHNIERQFRRC